MDKNILNEIKSLLEKELIQLDEVIRENAFSKNETLNQIIIHMQKMSGKRIRVLLTLLIGKMYGYLEVPIFKIAGAIEFIHNATLLHDDVIDCNTKRRGLDSANIIWNNKMCILSGDFLLSQAFGMISSVNNSRISQLFSETSSILVEGEMNQLVYNSEENVDFARYLSIIEAKTASLFSLSTIVGGIFAQTAEEEIDALRIFGHYLGIAFQIKDDILDYLGTEKELGKPIGVDYREKKMTLPLILLKQYLLDNHLEKVWYEEIWNPDYSDENLKRVIKYMAEYDIKSVCNARLNRYIENAKNSIFCFCRFQDYYIMLIKLLEFVALRDA